MRGRWMKLRPCGWMAGLACAIASMSFAPAWGQTSDAASAESLYRSAAALQERQLFDLAAAEWAALIDAHPTAPFATQARYQRGVCLFQAQRFAAAAAEFERVLAEGAASRAGFAEQARANLGLAYYNLGRAAEGADRDAAFDKALSSFTRQLDEYLHGPLALQATFLRAEIHYARGILPAAIADYGAVIDKDSNPTLRAQAIHALGVAEQESGEPAAAKSTFDNFLREFPDHELAADARLRRGEVLLELGRADRANRHYLADAVADFTAVCERWPESPLVPDALYARASAERKQGRLDAAESTFTHVLTSFPSHELATPARLLRASVRQERGRYAEAVADVDKYLSSNPRRAAQSDALLVRGMCEAALDRNEDAVRTFETILTDDPGYRAADRVLYELAWAYEEGGQSDRASVAYERLVTEHPASPLAAECWYRMGESKFAAADFAGGARCFTSAHAAASEAELKEKAAHRLAWAYFSAEQFDEAEQAFADQLTEFEDGALAADARVMIGESRFARKDFAGALAAFTEAFERPDGSGNIRALVLLHAAQAAGELKQWAKSLELADRAIAESPDSTLADEIRCERGWALFHQAQLDTAAREFAAVAEHRMDVVGARARFLYGEVQFARQKYDAAVRTFFQVAYGYGGEAAPEPFHRWQAEAMFEAARCLRQLGRDDAAEKLCRELLARFPSSAKAEHARIALRESRTR